MKQQRSTSITIVRETAKATHTKHGKKEGNS
ncbi:MAG: hypothetical protein ACJA2S_004187 [Cyclobacteriaceae bacterium]|jgi:hypothetical protein